MPRGDSLFAGSIPQIYDRFLVPLIFEPYARDLAARVAATGPRRVLETAAGTGVVTRALAPLLDAGARYDATDLNAPMLEHAAARQPGAGVVWAEADALALPFPDASFDAVLCQFGVMFFPQKRAAFAEANRVLRPDGRFFFNTWDRIEENDFAAVVTEAAGAFCPDDPPLFLRRTPHGYHDPAVIEQDLRAAGFAAVAIDPVSETSRAASPRDPAIAYCQGTPLRAEIEARGADLAAVTDRAAAAIAERYGAGAVAGRIRAHMVVAAT